MTELTDGAGLLSVPAVAAAKRAGRPPPYPLQEILDGVFDRPRGGWRNVAQHGASPRLTITLFRLYSYYVYQE